MKKPVLCALTATMMAVSLAGCGSAAPSSSAATTETGHAMPSAAGGKTVVEVWTNDRHDLDYVNKKTEEYNATNPDNIEIKQTVVTDDYFNMLTMAKTSGTAPDLAALNGGAAQFDLKVFAESGIIRPLNEYLENASEEYVRNTDYKDRLFEGMNALGTTSTGFPPGSAAAPGCCTTRPCSRKPASPSSPRPWTAWWRRSRRSPTPAAASSTAMRPRPAARPSGAWRVWPKERPEPVRLRLCQRQV